MSSMNTKIEKPPALRKVTIMTTGTRGDIQPFVAIGMELKKAGYSVRVMTQPSETHATLLKDFGLEHVPFGIDIDTFMREDKEARKSMETGDTINFFKCIASAVDKNTRQTCEPFYDEFIANDRKNRPDLLLVSYLNRYFGLYAKHVLKIPTIEIKLQHWVFDDPRRAPMGMPTLPMGMHKLIQTKVMVPQDFNNFKNYDECIADIVASRKLSKTNSPSSSNSSKELSTSCLDDFLLFEQLLESEVNHSPLLPMIICQSPHFKDILHQTLPKSQKYRFVGPAAIEQNDQTSKDTKSFGDDFDRKKMEEFIAADVERKPVYMGWGSMIRQSTHEMTIFAVEALMMSNQRGIVLGGSAGLSMEVLEEAVANDAVDVEYGKKLIEYARGSVIFVAKAPHEWLFPRVSLTVHHGGAGTMNAALRSGVPTIVTPVFGDQYDNSFVAQNLGVGVGFDQQLQKIDAKDLSAAIDAVVNDPAIAKRAKEVGDQTRNEFGCNAIVEEMEKHWREEVTSGKLFNDIKSWNMTTKEMRQSRERKILRNRLVLGAALAVAGIASIVYY